MNDKPPLQVPTSISPLAISHYTAASCAGVGRDCVWQALVAQSSGLKFCDFEDVRLETWIGEVAGLSGIRVPSWLREFDCRNNRLALLGLETDGFLAAAQRTIRRLGSDRVGLFLGTSTSGILESELAYRRRDPATGALPKDFVYEGSHNSHALASFVREVLGITGPAHVISTACSSSAKVFCSAERMIRAGLIDAAVVGGVDSLCLTTLYGFHSLELTAPTACRPFDQDRDGLSLGEAAAFALLVRGDSPESEGSSVYLCGYGESSDAHHMSAPHPEGRGARMAMQAALQRAGLEADGIDYVNLHGTATPSNDAAEGAAVLKLVGQATPCSSTKGLTGHTLGAAGALEAVICAEALRHQTAPAGANTLQLDPAIPIDYLLQSRQTALRFVLSNSFGFGGTNCSLILGSAAAVREREASS
jgi:3-oxoacyl-[acyl-carrier-protein] synthase-1